MDDSWWWMDDQWWRMRVKRCHKPPMTGNGNHTTYKHGGGACNRPAGLIVFSSSFSFSHTKTPCFCAFSSASTTSWPLFGVLQRSWIRSSFVSFASAKCEFLACRLKKKLWIDRMSCVFSGEMVFRAITVAATILFYSQVWNRQP